MAKRSALRGQLDHLAWLVTWRGGLRAAFQALWLGAAVVALGIAAHIWRDWPLDWRRFALAGLGVAVLYMLIDTLLNRVNVRLLARRIDQWLNLHEQTATALDVDRRGEPPGYLEGLLLDRAGQGVAQARARYWRTGWIPWRELETLLAVVLLGVGLYVLIGLGQGIPRPTARPLPALVDPAARPTPAPRLAQRPNQPNAGAAPSAALSEGLRRALDALAQALGDQAATAATAEALRQGDIPGAAEALRRLADQVGDLAPGTRAEIARSLRRGSQATQGAAPSLADQLRRSANDVERGGAPAARGLEDLARELERLGQSQGDAQASGEQRQSPGQGQGQGQQQGQGQGQGQSQQPGQGQGQGDGQGQGEGAGQGSGQQRSGEDDRTGVEGVPVELAAQPDPSGETTRRADPQAQPRGQASGGQFGQGGSPSGGAVEAAADPLRYPWELRSVVQDYFTPSR